MDDILTLTTPITEEVWDMLTDVDFDHTNRITFHTKHGKEVEFIKKRTGHWIMDRSGAYSCSECMEPCAGYVIMRPRDNFCKMCGADMRGEQE